MILATDMANHVSEIDGLKDLFAQNEIKDGVNIEKLVGEGVEDKDKFKY